MTDPQRLKPDARRAAILLAAIDLAISDGYPNLTRDGIAAVAGVSGALVTHYYPEGALYEAVMCEAVRLAIPEIVAAGIVIGSPAALSAPMGLKQLAAECLLEGATCP